jgi:hypothetical protein
MLNMARQRAKKHGIPFLLEPIDIKIPKKCPICKVVMRRLGDRNTSPSLDQIVPRMGYTKENCVVICYRCNTKKNDSTPEQLYVIADYIYQLRRERGLENVESE